MEREMSPLLKAALEYQKRGWSIIPIKIVKKVDIKQGKVDYDKKSLVDWKEYQTKLPTKEQIIEWWGKKYLDAGIALVTGAISGQIVLDLDCEEGKTTLKEKGIPLTPSCSTFKGRHLHLKHPGFEVRNFVKKEGLDLRGDGGYVVLPPTEDPRGGQYEWEISPDETELAEPPDWLLELIKEQRKSAKKMTETEVTTLLKGVKQGKRHDSATKLAGHWLGGNMAPSEALSILKNWNRSNQPPLPESELGRMVLDFAQKKAELEEEITELEKMAEPITQEKLNKLLDKAIPESGFLRNYIDTYREITDTPTTFLFWGAMAAVSAVLGKKAWIPWEARKLYANIWGVFLAPSGTRKGTGIDLATRLVGKVNQTLLLPQVASEEGMTKALDKKEGQDRGFVRWQEFAKILKGWTKTQNWQATQEFWIDLWDNKPLRKKLSKSEYNIPTTAISFLSACTPKGFAKFFTTEDLEGGFFGRVYLINCLKKEKYFAIPPSLEASGKENLIVKNLHEIEENFTGELSYVQIKDAFVHWGKEIQKNRKEGFYDSFYSRIETHAMKLCIIYEATLTQKIEIRVESFEYAINALDFLIASARPLISEEIGLSEEKKTILKIEKYIQKKGRISRRDVMRNLNLSSWEMDNLEKTLVDRGSIKVTEDKGQRGPGKKKYTSLLKNLSV